MAVGALCACSTRVLKDECEDFSVSGEFRCGPEDEAVIEFGRGYQVYFHGGQMDGSVKSGSLLHVRNLYRSLAADGCWTPFTISVSGKTIRVSIADTEVVRYTEPEHPYRKDGGQLAGKGSVVIRKTGGNVRFRGIAFDQAPDENSVPAIDEENDRAIRFQQEDFPVIDYHVHLKGGLTAAIADSLQKLYGINYGISPNAGHGGVGLMLGSDEEVVDYFESIKDLPFIRAVQGEGRKWTRAISSETLGIFDCLYTDAMTIVDPDGRLVRLYRPEEVDVASLGEQAYMDLIVDQTVKILTNEPADIYANATFIPAEMQPRYDELWTDERVDRVLDVLEREGIALEISSRYCIPSKDIILKAKERGIKFTFGTNNMGPDFGRLEYSLDMARECGLTPGDMWFPSMSTRAGRKAVFYNNFDDDNQTPLFDGKSLEGWVGVCEDQDVFSVKDSHIHVKGNPFGYLRTDKKYSDFTLHAEWRWIGEGTNSGIFLCVQDGDMVWPEAVECQLKAGRAGDLVCLGGAKVAEIPALPGVKFPVKPRNHPDVAVELEDGQWNRAEIICRGREMLVYINGNFENKAALPHDEGYIALQSEGGELEFKNIYIY